MNPLPDLSYFAIPGFVNQMRQRRVQTASLLLYHGVNDSWDRALSEENASLYGWLHEKTGESHDVYLPHSATPHLIRYYGEHIRGIIRPAQSRIRALLTRLEVEDVDEYLSDSDEWLSVVFLGKNEQRRACEIAAESLGLHASDLPVIVVWTDLESQSVLCILPNQDDPHIVSYIKTVYGAVLAAASRLHWYGGPNVSDLMHGFKEKTKESSYFQGCTDCFRRVMIVNLKTTVSSYLTDIGALYAESFNDAILNFEDAVEHETVRKSICRYASDTHANLVQRLRGAGCEKQREGHDHEIWRHPALTQQIALPRHTKISPFVAKKINEYVGLAEKAAS